MPVGSKRRKDLTGQRFGRLIVIGPAELTTLPSGTASGWIVDCDCGTKGKIVRTGNLQRQMSCGCYAKEAAIKRQTTHGMSKSKEYSIWHSAQCRAKKLGQEFDIKYTDIVIPKICPLLGIPIIPSKKQYGVTRNSPALDRIDTTKGYIKGNVWIISNYANLVKGSFTSSELKRFAEKLEAKENECR